MGFINSIIVDLIKYLIIYKSHMIFHRVYLTTIVILLLAPTLSALPLSWGSYRWI
jgi:hypothetical protein